VHIVVVAVVVVLTVFHVCVPMRTSFVLDSVPELAGNVVVVSHVLLLSSLALLVLVVVVVHGGVVHRTRLALDVAVEKTNIAHNMERERMAIRGNSHDPGQHLPLPFTSIDLGSRART
jgi:uncharacterized membrane protein